MEFGGLRAVGDLDFHIASEEMVGLIGPNGAGKSTMIKLLTGELIPDSGDVWKHPNMRIGDYANARTFA